MYLCSDRGALPRQAGRNPSLGVAPLFRWISRSKPAQIWNELANYPSPTVTQSTLAKQGGGKFRGRGRESRLLRRTRSRFSAQLRSATKIRACSFSSGARQSRRRPEEIAFVSDGDSSFGQLEQINESSIIILANPRLEWESAASGVPRSSVSALYFSSHQFDNVSRGASFEHRLRIYKASAFRSSARSNVTRIAEYFQAMEHIHCIRCFILR